MNKILRGLWITACFLLALIYLISCCSQFIPASVFSETVFLALLFPYLFAMVIGAGIVNLFVHKKWAVAMFLLLVPGLYNFFHVVAVSPLHSWKMEKKSGAIRVMSWNVSDFVNPALLSDPKAKKRKAILSTISEYNPDILCLQEYFNIDSCRDLGSAKHELDSLGYHYIVFSRDYVKREFYGLTERGVVICSKQPFTDSGRLKIRSDFHPEYLVFGDYNLQQRPVRMVTAHLASYYLFPDSAQGYSGKKRVAKKLYTYKNEVQEKLREIELMHDEQAAYIRRFLDTSSVPVIYCGDINATSTMYSYRLLKGDHQDAFLQAGNGIGATFFNMVPTLRIDMIFPDQHFEVLQTTVALRRLGDHDPIITDVKWR